MTITKRDGIFMNGLAWVLFLGDMIFIKGKLNRASINQKYIATEFLYFNAF